MSMRRLPTMFGYKLQPQPTFAEHVQHLLDFVVSWQCPDET